MRFGIGTGVTGAPGRRLNVMPLRGRSVVISSSDADRANARGRDDGFGNADARFASGDLTTSMSPVLMSSGESVRAGRLVKGSTWPPGGQE
jgi:hypothetical protein